MSEKTKWFYTDYCNETQAVVILAHGLNLHPTKMDQLAHFFNSNKCDVLRISLPLNANSWTESFSDDYQSALEHSVILQRPLYFIGYSLGALLGLQYILRHPQHEFKKLALIAPATHTYFFTKIPAMLACIIPKLSLKSSNLENYRNRDRTSFNDYKIMNQLQAEVGTLFKNTEINIPTLVITNPHDEVVKSSEVVNFSLANSNWRSLEMTNEDSQLPRKFHHLIIDKESCGEKQWSNLLKNLALHFSL
jgi:pimeloyl-ACP methyl ester carboxylesterase